MTMEAKYQTNFETLRAFMTTEHDDRVPQKKDDEALWMWVRRRRFVRKRPMCSWE